MIKVTVNDRKANKKLNIMSKKFDNQSVLMRRIAGDLDDAVEENFKKQGRPRWPRLSPITQKIRAQQGKTGKMLQVSGSLASSVNTRSGKDFAMVGTNKKYAKFVQEGWKQKVTAKQKTFLGMNNGIWLKEGTTMKAPPRPFIKLTKDDIKKIGLRIKRYYSVKN